MAVEDFEHEYDMEKLQVITPKKRDFKMLVTPRYTGHYCENAYENFTSDLLLNLSRDNMLFIDIGAHYGYYTVLMGTRHPDCKIIAFEPVPENFEILKRNISLNQLKNTELHNVAVSDSDGVRKFNVTEASDSCGFYEHPLTQTSKVIKVRTVCLDNFLKETPKVPTIIKLDAEGHEPHILKGMKKILIASENIKLIIEFNPKCLRSGGYKPAGLLEDIFQYGFDTYVIDDNKRLTYKLTQDSFEKWHDYLPEGDENRATNLLCIKKEKSLSVCFFSHLSQLAGAERSLLELTRQLIADYGVVCSVILPGEGPLREKLEDVGASTLVMDYHWWCNSTPLPPEEMMGRLSSSFVNLLNNLRELGKINPDVILTSTLVIPWGAIAASFLGKPHVWSIREFGELDHNLKFHLPFQTALKVIKDSSNLILVNSNAVRNTLFGETSPKNILIIYPHIDIPSTALLEDGNNYFTRMGATRLIIFGAIAESKGHKDAILAVKELVQRKQDVELVAMGYANPIYLEQLKELVKLEALEPYVHFIDFKENPYPVVNKADIVLVCSRNEAFGRVTLEAMLLKKPVIGTNTGGTPELIKEGLNGLLYAPGDYRQLADKIEYLIQNKEKIKEFGENGYKFAKENFTKEKSGGKLAELLQRLKGKANPLSSSYSNLVSGLVANSLSNAISELNKKNTQITNLESIRQAKDAYISSLESTLQAKDAHISSLESTLQEKAAQISSLEVQMQQIQRGIVMQLLNRYQTIINKVMCPGTKLRNYYELVLAGIRVILNEGWRSFWHKFKQWQRQKRQVKKDISRQPDYKKGKSPDVKHNNGRIEKHKPFDKFSIHVNDPANVIVLVSHDARLGGASQLALHLAKTMAEKFNRELIIILLQSGPLEGSFRKYGKVFCLQLSHFGFLDNPDQANSLIAALKNCGIKYCILNSVISGCLCPLFKKHGFHTVSLIHELPASIELLNTHESAKSIAQYSDKIIFAAEFVKQQFLANYGAREEKTVIRPQGLYKTVDASLDRAVAKQKLSKMIGAGEESFIFLGCGLGDLRKGVDLFIQVARLVLMRIPKEDVHFIWVGGIVDKGLKTWAEHDIEKLNIKGRVHLFDYTDDIIPFYAGSDAFLLTSREDPFPTVFQTALDAGLPVIAFKDAGGVPEALEGGRGVIVPYLDISAMADAAMDLVLNKTKRQEITEKAKQLVKYDYDFAEYCKFLQDVVCINEKKTERALTGYALKSVSVIVPNYNYEKYLPERLQSIIDQTYKPYEIIFLDDASTDRSVELARRILQQSGVKFSIIENRTNEGVFKQWLKGFQMAEGELVWVAEADDFCEPNFLEKIIPKFDDDDVVLAYTQSQIIDETSGNIDYSYTSYTADLSPDKWNSDYYQNGALEINDGLAIKNTIPNASAVVMRKNALAGIEDTLRQFKICGDWFTYVYVLRKGKVSFYHQSLNYHRRHTQSIISKSEKTELFYKEILSIQEFILKNYIIRTPVWEQMKKYLKTEYQRLGCHGHDSRDIMRNPSLASRVLNLDRLGQKRSLNQNQKHKIMVIIPDLEFGGGQMFGIRLANFLSETNDVFLYNARPYLESRGIRSTISPAVRLFSEHGNSADLSKIIDSEDIDTIISNVWWADKLAYFAVKDRKVKWFIVMHGCYEALVANPHWDGDFLQLVGPLLMRADQIVYTAEKNLTAIASLDLRLKNSPVKINNGFCKPDAVVGKRRIEFGVAEGDFVFGLISRAIPEKGWEPAIIATLKLNEILDNRRVHLFLIGESDYAAGLRRKYKKEEVIHFVGFQANLSEWIYMFDAGLLPTYFQSESQPLIIIEFLAHNKPVIATDIGDIRTMLIRGKKRAGILLPLVDGTIQVDDLFLAMKRFVYNEDHIYDRLKDNCEELFSPYDMKTCAESYLSLLEMEDKGRE